MAESEIKKLQNEVCDLPEQPEPFPKICPTCVIDPTYVEPTWWETTEPYLNLKICEYQVAITSTEDFRNKTPAEIKYLAQRSVKKGIREIIREYSKLERDTEICAFAPTRSSQVCRLYLPPELIKDLDEQGTSSILQLEKDLEYNKTNPEDRFNASAIEVQAYVKDIYYGDRAETFKILVSVPAEAIDLLAEAPFGAQEQEEIEDQAQTDQVVILDGPSFKNTIIQLKAIFKLYSRYQSAYYMLQRVSLLQEVGGVTKKLRLVKFPPLFEQFKDSLEGLLKENNFKLRRFKSRKTVDKIRIKFDKRDFTRPYNIKSIEARYEGCPYIRLKGLNSFKKRPEVKNQTLMHYIANSQDMIDEIENSGEPPPWLDFIAENTYPPVTIDFGSADSRNEELESCIDEQYLGDLRDSILEKSMSFLEAIEFSFNISGCKSIENYKENNIVEKQKKRLRKERLTKEERKAKRAKRRAETEQERRAKRLQKEEQQQTKQLIKSNIEELEELEFDISNVSLTDEQIDFLSFNYFRSTVLGKDLDPTESSERQLKADIKAFKFAINSAQESLAAALEDGKLPPAVKNVYRKRVESFVENKQKELDDKKEELKELQRIKRNEKFPLTETLSSKNIKRLWEETSGPEPKEPSLFQKIADSMGADAKEARKDKYKRDSLGKTLLARLSPCNWEQVLFDIIECLLGGMTLQEAIPIIIRSTLSKSSPFVLEKVLQGLPPEVQEQVEASVKQQLAEISNDAAAAFKKPWDAERERAEKEELFDNTAERDKAINSSPDPETPPEDTSTAGSQRRELKKEKKELEKANDKLKEVLEKELEEDALFEALDPDGYVERYEVTLLKGRIEQNVAKIEQIDKELETLNRDLNEQETASSNAINNIADTIFNAYVEALLEYAGVDRLTEMIDKIPGANVFKRIFLQSACPVIDPISFGVKDLFGSLRLGFCKPEATGYLLPSIPQLPELRGFGIKASLQFVLDEFKDKLVQLVNQAILALFVKVLELIDTLQCNSIGSLGALLANQLTGQEGSRNGLYDAINDAFCNSNGNVDDTQDDLLNRAGIPDAAKSSIANSISRAMSPNEIKQALLNCDNVPQRAWTAIYGIIQVSYPDLLEIINGPEDVQEIFCIMGDLLSPEQRDSLSERMDPTSEFENRPIDRSICLTNAEREAWDQRRIDFYNNEGLDREAAEDFVNGLNDKALSDLADLLDLFVNGPDGVLKDIFGQAFEPNPDPECIESLNIIPPPPEEIKRLQEDVSNSMFSSISDAFTRDMIGNRHAFIDNVLADERGLRLTGFFQHEMRVNFDLLYPDAADSIEDHRRKYDNSGYLTRALMARKISPEDEFEDNQEGDPPKPEANHLFPQTISIHVREQLIETISDLSFESSKTEPTFRLKFRDISEAPEPLGYDFDKGFNLIFNNSPTTDNQYTRDGFYTIRKVDVTRVSDSSGFLEDGTFKIQKTRDFTLRVPHGIENNSRLVGQIDPGEDRLTQPYTDYLFSRYIQGLWSRAGVNNIQGIESFHDQINTAMLKALTEQLLTDNRDPDGLSVGFRFGYNNDKITYEDLLYVNPEATEDPETWEYTYEEEDKILGKSATGNKRVKFLDPAKYGGKYTRPKYYIEQPQHDGWFRMLQIVVPELDGCDPRKSDFLFLEELVQRVDKLENSIQMDKRMRIDQDCTQEPAFDKLLTPTSEAYIEGAVTATIRAYCAEAILRTIPIISQVKLDFKKSYDDAFLSLVINKMEDGMNEQGAYGNGFTFSRIKEYTYWILFLEQVVQMSFRKIEDGTLQKSSEILGLLKQANQVSKRYIRPERDDILLVQSIKSYGIDNTGRIDEVEPRALVTLNQRARNRAVRLLNALAFGAYGKDYQKVLLDKERENRAVDFRTLKLQKLKTATREHDVHLNIKLCKDILKYHVSAQLEEYSKKLDEFITPQPYISDVGKFFIGASGLCKNHNIQAGLSEVENPIGDSPLPYGDINEVVKDPSTLNPLEGVVLTNDEKTNGVFFLEKYLVITPKPLPLIQDYATSLSGVVSISEFKDELSQFQGDKDKLISEVMGNAEITEDGESYEGSIGIKFGVRLCFCPPSGFSVPNAIEFDRAFKATAATDHPSSAYYFPVVKYEQDITDRLLSEIDLEDSNIGEDLKCYVDRLTLTEEFNLIFNSLLVTRKVPSLIGIYLYDGFIDSIGVSTTEREEGKENRGNGKWKSKILDDTKDRCRALFASNLRLTDADRDQENTRERNRNRSALIRNLLPSGLINIDRSVKWWQLRTQVEDRPYDKDGNDCVNELAAMFGG